MKASLILLFVTAHTPLLAESVQISVPASVWFQVANVTTSTAGTNFTITYQNASVLAGRVLRISVRAAAGSLTPPSGSSIPATNVAWVATGSTGGVGLGGTLSEAVFTPVFQSNLLPASGGVTLSWTLSAPGSTGMRAGMHSLALEWKVESLVPIG